MTLLIYGVNIGCDFLAINLLTNYSATQSYEEGISYGTVVLIMFSEIAAEKILMKNKEKKETSCEVSLNINYYTHAPLSST